jgi:hypothetical protein
MSRNRGTPMNEQLRGNRWFGLALACVLIALCVWLRSWSDLWQYRWTGFLVGLAVGLYAQRATQASYHIAKRYDIPRRVYLAGAIVFIAMGASSLKRFFLNGNGDDGFLSILFVALAISQARVCRWLWQRCSETIAQQRQPKLNHG